MQHPAIENFYIGRAHLRQLFIPYYLSVLTQNNSFLKWKCERVEGKIGHLYFLPFWQ